MDIVVGTAGHIDHGKTALVKALTGTDTDRLPEEKERGITIDLGFAEIEHDGVHFGFVDVPGHERFVKNMLAGASGIDLVLLVVAADEGVMPQTREHFDICRLLGVSTGLIAITKSDLVDGETLELVKAEVADLVAGSFLDGAKLIAVSSRNGDGIADLKGAMPAAASNVPSRSNDLVIRLPIDRSFTKKGFGTVITGTLSSGELTEGNELDLLPSSFNVRARGVQTHGRTVRSARAGNRTAVNLAGIDHQNVSRGMMLAEKGALRPTLSFDAEVQILASASRPIRSRQRVRLHISSAEVLGRVSVLNEIGELAPGRRGFVQFRLESPVAPIFGERFVVRSYSPQMTIAGGVVLDSFAERHQKKAFADDAQFLRRLLESSGDPKSLLFHIVRSSGTQGISFNDIRSRTGWKEGVLNNNIAENRDEIVGVENIFVTRPNFDSIKSDIIRRVAAFHKREPLASGMSRESLKSSMSRTVVPCIFDAAIAKLVEDRELKLTGDLVRSASQETKLSDAETKAKARLESIYSSAKLEPPKLEEVLVGERTLRKEQTRRIFQLLIDDGSVIKVSEEFYFASDAIKALRTKLSAFAERTTGRTIDVAQFKDLAQITRKYAIPLLEYFDREKVTIRTGDKRMILK